MAKREVWVGIDVSKRRLDVALGVHGELLQVDNDPGGFTVLLEKLGALGPELIVLEASGGYETALVGELVEAKLPVVVVNPRQVRDFARAIGLRRHIEIGHNEYYVTDNDLHKVE